MEPIIQVKDVSFRYEGEDESAAPVLDHVSLEIEAGSFVVILGHNGSGKSTLAKHLNGILVPDEGEVLVDGMDTKDDDKLLDIRRTVGMVFQNPDNQMVASVVEDDVAFAPENLGVPPDEIRARVDEALKLVGMYEFRDRAPHLLSGGQKQRVAIAGVIAMRPRCIVLDEPTAMLDPGGRRGGRETVTRLWRENGITELPTAHHMSEAVGADKVFVMSAGHVISEGTPEAVFSKVEALRKEGLTVPDTVALSWELRGAGLDIPLAALTSADCAAGIAKALQK